MKDVKKMIKKMYIRFMNSNRHLRKLLNANEYIEAIGLKVGEGCYISTKNFAGEPYLISIGDNVRIAKGVSFYTHGGIWTFRKEFPELDYFGKISIGNNCYIGEDAKILPGVTIENDCIIGAGSIVTKSIPKGCVVAGNPAIYVGETSEFIKKIKKFDVKTKNYSPLEKKRILLSLDDKKFLKKKFLKKDK